MSQFGFTGATWKGVDKPGGTHFYAPPSYADLPDCPKCKYGTIMSGPTHDKMCCIDCKATFDRAELERLGIIHHIEK